MAKPNYSFQKRQKELSKKAKKEEKRQKKQLKNSPEPDDNVIMDGNDNFSQDKVEASSEGESLND